MSHLVARILLAILMLPAAAMVYIVTFITALRTMPQNESGLFILGGSVMWAFIILYWLVLWIGIVRFTGTRIAVTLLVTIGALAAGLVIGLMGSTIERGMGPFIGSVAAPLCWLIAVIFVWRETAEERAGAHPLRYQIRHCLPQMWLQPHRPADRALPGMWLTIHTRRAPRWSTVRHSNPVTGVIYNIWKVSVCPSSFRVAN